MEEDRDLIAAGSLGQMLDGTHLNTSINNFNIKCKKYHGQKLIVSLYFLRFRSFFKRRGKRSSSRDPGGNGNGSKELASYSDVASLSYADNLQYQEENPPVNSYIRVERLDCK